MSSSSSLNLVREFIKTLHSSGEVPVLLHSVETSASEAARLAGHALCHALRSSWASLLLGEAVSTPRNRCTATNGEDGSPSSMYWAQVAQEYSWEQLHTGHWKDVKRFWKEAYSFASLLKGLNFYHQGRMAECLVEIDMGILMGAPVFNNSLHTVAAMVSKELEASKGVVLVEGELSACEGVVLAQEGTALDDTDYVVGMRESAKPPNKIGKVTFRNYRPNSDSTKKRKVRSSSPLACSTANTPLVDMARRVHVANTPLIDMARRVPVAHCPSLEEFHQRHMAVSVPVVVSGAMDSWPAYAERKWK